MISGMKEGLNLKALRQNKLKFYIIFISVFLLIGVFQTIYYASRSDSNQLVAYHGVESIPVSDGWKNTSGQDVNIVNQKYFSADGLTPYVYHRLLPDTVHDGLDLCFMVKNAGFIIFISDPDKQDVLTEIDYPVVTEENNQVTVAFKGAVNKFVHQNADVYHLTDCLLLSCGEGSGLGARGVGTNLHTTDVSGYAGKEAYIVFFPMYESSKISNIRLQHAQYFVQDMVCGTFMAFTLSLIIVIIANALLTMALFMEISAKKVYASISMLIITIGLWLMLSSRTFDFVLGTNGFTTTMCYYLLMIVPVFGAIYMDQFTFKEHFKMTNVVCPVAILNMVLSTLSNYVWKYDLYQTKIVSDAIIVFTTVWALILLTHDFIYRRKHNLKRFNRANIFNLALVMVCTIIDIARTLSLTNIAADRDAGFFIRIGVLVFVFGMLIDVYSGYVVQHRKASLTSTFRDIAFLDELTGIENRAAFAKYEAELEAYIKDLSAKADDSQSIIYASLDLNDLKYVNDNLGHAVGDVYIKTAARILKTSFHSANIYRTGGDEFALFIVGPDARADYEGGLKRMVKAQDEYNATAGSGIHMEFAYGVAEWRYFDMRSLHQLEVDADKLMYENKRKMKAKRGQTAR